VSCVRHFHPRDAFFQLQADNDGPIRRRRTDRVDEQVDHDVAQRGAVAPHDDRPGRLRGRQCDRRGGSRGLQQFQRLVDDAGDIDRRQRAHRPACEGVQASKSSAMRETTMLGTRSIFRPSHHGRFAHEFPRRGTKVSRVSQFFA
jgi:hypothetical protein